MDERAALAQSGTSIGPVIFPTLAMISLERYDWRRVLTGLAILPPGALRDRDAADRHVRHFRRLNRDPCSTCSVYLHDIGLSARVAALGGWPACSVVFEAISSGSGLWNEAALSDYHGGYQPAFAACCALRAAGDRDRHDFMFRRAARITPA